MLRLVTYVDSSACSPCTLNHLYTWNDYLEEARQYKGKLKYIFIFAPKPGKYNLEDVHLSIESCGVKCPVYVDTSLLHPRQSDVASQPPQPHALPELKGKVNVSDNYILVKCRIRDK